MERFTKRFASGNVGFYGDGTPTENALKLPGTLSKLCDLEDAEQQGRLVVLPCKVGDTVWSLEWNVKTESFDIVTSTIKNVRYNSADGALSVSDGEYIRPLGKKCYLTRAEAEAAPGKEKS